MHDFDLGLLPGVCYPKRSYSPLFNFLSDLNGAYTHLESRSNLFECDCFATLGVKGGIGPKGNKGPRGLSGDEGPQGQNGRKGPKGRKPTCCRIERN